MQPDDFVHVLLARYDPGAGIGWHRDRDVFEQVVGISLATPADASLPPADARRLRPRQPRCRAALRLPAVGRSHGWDWEHQHHAGRGAALLDHLPDTVGKGPADRGARLSGTRRTRGTVLRACASVACSLLLLAACSKGPEADLQYIKQARSLAAEWALVNEQAEQGKLTAPYVASMRKSAARPGPDRGDVADRAGLALTPRNRGASAAARRCRRRQQLRAHARTSSSRSRTALNPLELTLGIMTAVGGFVDISELVFAAKAGSTFGYALIWVFAFSTVGIIVFGEMSGRVAAVAKQPVFNLMRHRLGLKLGLVTLAASLHQQPHHLRGRNRRRRAHPQLSDRRALPADGGRDDARC